MSASSPFLNQPLRTEAQAYADRERARRLGGDEPNIREILDGAFVRNYRPDGSYELVPVVGGVE